MPGSRGSGTTDPKILHENDMEEMRVPKEAALQHPKTSVKNGYCHRRSNEEERGRLGQVGGKKSLFPQKPP